MVTMDLLARRMGPPSRTGSRGRRTGRRWRARWGGGCSSAVAPVVVAHVGQQVATIGARVAQVGAPRLGIADDTPSGPRGEEGRRQSAVAERLAVVAGGHADDAPPGARRLEDRRR